VSSASAGRRRPLLALSLVGVGLVVAAACTTEGAVAPVASTSTVAPLARLPQQAETDPTIPFPPGFVPIDSRGVNLPHLEYPDLPQAPVPVIGGNAKMTGTVFGPDGPVAGATVRLERFVGARGGFADVTTDADGKWEADGVFGGKFRVRAWVRHELATTEPQVAFVTDAPDTTVNLAILVERHDSKRIQAALSVGDPRVDELVTLLVLHDQEDVGDDGIVRSKPIPNVDIDLSTSDGIAIDDSTRPPQRTGGDGFARFTIRCTSLGAHDVTLTGDGQSVTVTLPECLPGTTDTAPTTSSTNQAGVSGAGNDLAIGQTFTTPRDDAVPAGTYTSDAEGSCSTDFEQLFDGDWVRQHITGRTLTFSSPARHLTPAAGSRPCTFRRVS
jgi:hypothetical protein